MGTEADSKWHVRTVISERWRAALLAGVAFWLPDVLYHYLARSEPTTGAIWALTLIMPSAVAFAYFMGGNNAQGGARSRSFSMLLGVWYLGPTMIILGQTFGGAGFRNIQTLPFWAVATVFPPLTLMLAGYDLTVPGLLLATIFLVLAYRIVERPRKASGAF